MKRFTHAVAVLASALLLVGLWLGLRPQNDEAARRALDVRAETCQRCHADVTGLGESHAPQRIGCSSCHLGDPAAADALAAHRGMLRVPGNVADARRTCGQAACHVAIAARIENSIMTTMAGVITANRRVLGEAGGDDSEPPTPADLTHSVADSHLRELCVSCHLAQPKTEWGPVTQESRGGGCNACHLVYSEAALAELARYRAERADGAPDAGASSPVTDAAARMRAVHATEPNPPRVHPGLTPDPTNGHCFGCHSRSSRIALSYEGWNELRGEPPPNHPRRTRRLEDGRYVEYVGADLHHERGLQCIDCHTAAEVMGSGARAARKSDQQQVGCADCHARRVATLETDALDPETRTLLALRGWRLAPGERVGATRAGAPLVNVVVDASERAYLRLKRAGAPEDRRPLIAPAAACTEDAGHARLACTTCHTAWAPRCTTCHTAFDPDDEGFDHVAHQWVPGTWNETAGPFEGAPPTLALRTHANAPPTIETAVPGMILTFDRNRVPGGQPDLLFRRLYGPMFAHTVQKRPRPCAACHAEPIALGYGAGALRYEVNRATGRWRFTPREKPSPHDGLPADAWTGFLQTRTGMVSAREDLRPLDSREQQRVLRVGACLACHDGDSPVMRGALKDFNATAARRSARCVLPSGWAPPIR